MARERTYKGSVLRVSTEARRFFEAKGENLREAVDLTIQENLDLRARLEQIESRPMRWTLPSLIWTSKAKAKGEALLRAVKRGKEKAEEEPIPLREIG